MTFECPPCSQFDVTLSVPTLVFCRNHFFLFFQACLNLSSSQKPSSVTCVHSLWARSVGAKWAYTNADAGGSWRLITSIIQNATLVYMPEVKTGFSKEI